MPALDDLPDDALASVLSQLRQIATDLHHVTTLFACNKRLAAMLANSVEVLELSGRHKRGMLRIPAGRYGASLLMPAAWAQRLAGLRALELHKPSVMGAARLLPLLRAWPALEELEIRF
eukprot:4661878-Prymnesium_polylepis.1